MTYRLFFIFTLVWIALGIIPGAVVVAQQTSPEKKLPPPTWRKLVGLDDAYRRLRSDLPLGRGIAVGYVESETGGYLPNAKDQRLTGIEIVPYSGDGPSSGHATRGATIGFGTKGIAPGVKVIHSYRVPHWLGPGYLNAGKPDPPHDNGLRLFNHSWISNAKEGAANRSATIAVLRRVDYQVDVRDVVMCVGVNNGRDSAVPPLLASAYNVIAVGSARGGGNSSGGYTTIEGRGRCKPDIVGPRDLTSFATPSVTACAAILMERANAIPDERARRAELIKAVLLSGAVKPNFWTNAPDKPLDEHLGAGIVNIDRSLQSLDAGPIDTNILHRPVGWDMLRLRSGESRVYRFETARLWREATIVIVWHRRIDGRRAKRFGTDEDIWLDIPRLTNIDLQLTRYDDNGTPKRLAQSISTVDNVEHIYRLVLPPGRYRIEIVRQEDKLDEQWDVALAWWMRPAPRK